MPDRIWRSFRQLPVVLQIIGWLFFFWVLIPLLIWRSSLPRSSKWVLTSLFVVVVIAAGASDPTNTPTTEVADDDTGDSEPPAEDVAEEDTGNSDGSDSDPATDEPGGTKEKRPSGRIASVTRVVDGDTIEVSLGGRVVDVRLIGVDTPETVHPSEPVGCYGPAASDFTKQSLAGESVRLEFDVERLDRYERTLAYVWVGGKLFNQVLVERGFAQVSTYPPNVKYVARFTAAQRRARNGDRGLWGSCRAGGGDSQDSSDGGGGGQGNCDPNYEGACIPPYPPDLDCTEISASGFRSVGSDPHGFDGDGDGIACE